MTLHDEKFIEEMFDSFSKKVIKNIFHDILRHEKIRAKREKSIEIQDVSICDEYTSIPIKSK